MDVQSLTTSDLIALAFQVLQELANRLGRLEGAQGSSEGNEGPAPDAEPGLLVPDHCGYRCTFCENPCSRSDPGHRHHKCRQHRRW